MVFLNEVCHLMGVSGFSIQWCLFYALFLKKILKLCLLSVRQKVLYIWIFHPHSTPHHWDMCLMFLRPRSSTIPNHYCNSGLDFFIASWRNKIPVESNMKKNGLIVAYNLWVQCILSGKPRHQKCEAVSSMAPALGKQRKMNAGTLYTFSFYSVSNTSLWDLTIHVQGGSFFLS